MSNNSFKKTKAEQDMRNSSREMEEWLKTSKNIPKITEPQTSSQQPIKNYSKNNL